MKITPVQNKILHAMLNSTKMTEQKAVLVLAYTDGRSESSRDLLASEAQEMISYLKTLDNKDESANKMRRKILAMCHRIHWKDDDGKLDMGRLNGWCRERSYLKKNLNDYAYNELPKLVTEFQKVYKFYISKTVA